MEEPIQFTCNHKRLYGILHLPDAIESPSTVVILITGGPQVRFGAHRLYVQLSRFLCEQNIASFRFDHEGLGDSEGDFVGFQNAQASIDSSIIILRQRFKTNMKFLLWSLCDGATAAVFHAATHPDSVNGMILCNPLVITDQGLARSTIRHYYAKRILKKDFLQKLIRFDLDLKNTIRSIWKYFYDAHFLSNGKSEDSGSETKYLPDMVFDSLGSFDKPVRIILSTDEVAANFQDELRKNKKMRKAYNNNNIINYTIKGADHTFTNPTAKKELFALTLKGILDLIALDPGKRPYISLWYEQ